MKDTLPIGLEHIARIFAAGVDFEYVGPAENVPGSRGYVVVERLVDAAAQGPENLFNEFDVCRYLKELSKFRFEQKMKAEREDFQEVMKSTFGFPTNCFTRDEFGDYHNADVKRMWALRLAVIEAKS